MPRRCSLLPSLVQRSLLIESTQSALRAVCINPATSEAIISAFLTTRDEWEMSVWHRRINRTPYCVPYTCQGYCSPDLPTFEELCDSADDELFGKAVRLTNHILHDLLPPPPTASQHYELRHHFYISNATTLTSQKAGDRYVSAS